VPFEPLLTAGARHNILDLTEIINMDLFALHEINVPSQAELLHEIQFEEHACPRKQVNRKFKDVVTSHPNNKW
jgi:hypothetical protein